MGKAEEPIQEVVEADAAIGQAAPELPEPTDEEWSTLRKVPGRVPKIAYLLCAVEFAERASYYGCSFVFSNFVEFPLPKGGNGAGATVRGTEQTAGALGQGQRTATALTLLFTFLAYAVPIFGGWIADTRWGKYRTIVIGVLIAGIAHIIMVVGAIPKVLQAGHGLPPFIISLITLALGAGLFKPNIAPLVLEQNPYPEAYVRTEKNGERVIVDPEATAQRVMLTFYGLVNVGAFFGVATTYSEKYVGFWLAYLLPGIVYFLLPLLLAFGYSRTVRTPPQGSQLGVFFKVIFTAIRQNGLTWKAITNPQQKFVDAAKPSNLGYEVSWSEKFVDDVGRTIDACWIFTYFIVYNLNDGGIGNIVTSQGSSMTTKGAPNDLLSNFNPLTIIVLVPILNYGLYPLLRKYNVDFGPIKRITFGFFLAVLSAVAGAITQWKVYEKSPCGYYATGCEEGSGVAPISIWIQVFQYSTAAASECFSNVSAYEVAYSRAPKSMRGIVMALFLFMTAFSSAISQAITPVLVDPHLIWPFVGTGAVGLAQLVYFYWRYRHIDYEEFNVAERNESEKVPEQA